MIFRASGCRRHWPALVDFVDRAEHGPATPAALGHLDRCARCRADLETTALAIIALRRLGDEVHRVPVPTTTWRPERRARRRQQSVALAGAMLATAFAGLLTVPVLGLMHPAAITETPDHGPAIVVNRLYDPPARSYTGGAALATAGHVTLPLVLRLGPIAIDRVSATDARSVDSVRAADEPRAAGAGPS